MLNAGRDNATVLFIWECPVGSSTKKTGAAIFIAAPVC
jgi:hypothetical protein